MTALPHHRLAHLRGEGAEFIAVGELLVRGVEAHKTYFRQQGFDLIAVGPTGRSVTIQVKSSIQAGIQLTATNLLADWFVFMRFRRDGETRDRYVVRRAALPELQYPPSGLARWVDLHRVDDLTQYQDAWHLIAESLRPADDAVAPLAP